MSSKRFVASFTFKRLFVLVLGLVMGDVIQLSRKSFVAARMVAHEDLRGCHSVGSCISAHQSIVRAVQHDVALLAGDLRLV